MQLGKSHGSAEDRRTAVLLEGNGEGEGGVGDTGWEASEKMYHLHNLGG